MLAADLAGQVPFGQQGFGFPFKAVQIDATRFEAERQRIAQVGMHVTRIVGVFVGIFFVGLHKSGYAQLVKSGRGKGVGHFDHLGYPLPHALQIAVRIQLVGTVKVLVVHVIKNGVGQKFYGGR